MKDSTKKVLLWLYPIDVKNRWVTYRELEFFLPKLSASGKQSLISYLTSKQEILTEKIAGQTKIALTASAKKTLELEFPALSIERAQWNGNWSLICFLQSPKADHNFRYLRMKLIAYKCISLSRGVFLFPGQIPTNLFDILEKIYKTNVLILNAQKFIFGDELSIIGHKINLFDCIDLYSGISKETDQLLTKNKYHKILTNQEKIYFASLFSRLVDIFNFDYGLVKNYFPQEVDGREILFKMQTMFEL